MLQHSVSRVDFFFFTTTTVLLLTAVITVAVTITVTCHPYFEDAAWCRPARLLLPPKKIRLALAKEGVTLLLPPITIQSRQKGKPKSHAEELAQTDKVGSQETD